MRIWLTASDIAKAALPGLPRSKRGVFDLVEREGWMARDGLVRAGKGRGAPVEFHIDLLPAEARGALATALAGKVEVSKAQAEAAAREPEAKRLTAAAAENRDARLAVLNTLDRFRVEGGLSRQTADGIFVHRYNLGKVKVAPWIRAALPQLATRTVARWRADAKAGTTHRLAVDHGAKRRGKGALERQDVKTFCLALVAKQPHLSAKNIRKITMDHFPDFKAPALRTFGLSLAKWKTDLKVELTYLTNPDAFHNSYRLSGTNSHPVSRLNELWMIDASPVDVLTRDGRNTIYICIDVYSRRIRITVTKTPRAEAVGLLMRAAVLAWGVPERLKTDNGSDFVAHASTRLFAALGIDVDTSTPFAPWEKGHVERVIRTFQHDCGPLLPGFCGHNVADRKVIEARRAFAQRLGDTDDHAFAVDLTAAELQGYVDRWAAEVYAQAPHAALDGVTPFARTAGAVGTIKAVDIRALDVLLQPVAEGGFRTVGKKGIRVDGSWYLAPTVMPETRVLVRMDPADMGRALLFAADGQDYLGEAICPELAGIDPAAAVAEARAEQNRVLREGTADIRRAMREIKPRDMIDAVLRQSAKDAGKLVEFPRTAVAHTTPALEAAAEAVRASQTSPTPVVAVTVTAPASDFADAPNVQRLRMIETPQQRFRRALDLEAALAGQQPIGTEDALWLGGYQVGSEYRGMRSAYQDFGAGALL